MNIICNESGIVLHHENKEPNDISTLAKITYWDAEGATQTTTVTNGDGWHIMFIQDATGCRWQTSQPELGLCITFVVIRQNDGIVLRVPHDSILENGQCLLERVTLTPDFIFAEESDSVLVLPYEEGALCHCRDKEPGIHILPMYYPYPSYANMALYGIDWGDGNAIAAIIEDGRFDCTLEVKTCWGKQKRYGVDPVFCLRDFSDETLIAEDSVIRFGLLHGASANYVGMGKFYRQHESKRRNLPTLAKKINDNPILEYSSRAISIRCRMGVKPMPVTILEQTPETQPPVKVFMTFDNVATLINECASQQIGPAEFNLVGWNYGGHDGAFPQLFPVEPALGGEKKLRELIDGSHRRGYPMSLHDNYFDAYSLAREFDLNTICRNHDGSMTMGGQYGGGQAYQLCAECACTRYATKNLPEVAALGVKGAYYSDVLSIAQLGKCYHPEHSMSRNDNAYWWKKIMGMQHDLFGVSMSEGARDWALPELDRAYLVSLTTQATVPFIDEKVPIFQIAFHGYLIYNSFRGGINTFAGDDIYLRNIAYGGMPIVYYHQIFNPAWTAADGWDRDLTFGDAEKLKHDVSRIKQITDDVKKYSRLQTEFIENFITHSPTFTETVFSDGSRIFVNYHDQPCEIEKHIVPPRDFLVVTR